jgi:hypothetical protein
MAGMAERMLRFKLNAAATFARAGTSDTKQPRDKTRKKVTSKASDLQV